MRTDAEYITQVVRCNIALIGVICLAPSKCDVARAKTFRYMRLYPATEPFEAPLPVESFSSLRITRSQIPIRHRCKWAIVESLFDKKDNTQTLGNIGTVIILYQKLASPSARESKHEWPVPVV